MKIKLFILLLFPLIVFAQSLKPSWRWSNEPIMKNPDASALHFIGSAYLAGTFENSMSWWEADLLSLTLGVGWEIKDGFVRWEDFGIIGGEGFSKNDLICDVSGILLHRLGVLCWNKVKYGKWQLGEVK